MLDTLREHSLKVIAIGSILCLYGYISLRKRIWNKEQKSLPILHDPKPNYVLRICLTGGPCAGKTTAMDLLYSRLSEEGINTYIVPEAATLIADSGGMLNTKLYSPIQLMEFQYNLLKAQILLQTAFLEIAVNDTKNKARQNLTVILCDRGLMDGKAYMDKDMWERMLKIYNIRQTDMRDKRYDAVFHLVTAADGATMYYTTANNTARGETIDEAVQRDGHTREVWFGHPRLTIFDNVSSGSFQEKLEKVVNSIEQLIKEHQLRLNID